MDIWQELHMLAEQRFPMAIRTTLLGPVSYKTHDDGSLAQLFPPG